MNHKQIFYGKNWIWGENSSKHCKQTNLILREKLNLTKRPVKILKINKLDFSEKIECEGKTRQNRQNTVNKQTFQSLLKSWCIKFTWNSRLFFANCETCKSMKCTVFENSPKKSHFVMESDTFFNFYDFGNFWIF